MIGLAIGCIIGICALTCLFHSDIGFRSSIFYRHVIYIEDGA